MVGLLKEQRGVGKLLRVWFIRPHVPVKHSLALGDDLTLALASLVPGLVQLGLDEGTEVPNCLIQAVGLIAPRLESQDVSWRDPQRLALPPE